MLKEESTAIHCRWHQHVIVRRWYRYWSMRKAYADASLAPTQLIVTSFSYDEANSGSPCDPPQVTTASNILLSKIYVDIHVTSMFVR